jgi:signal peptidase I
LDERRVFTRNLDTVPELFSNIFPSSYREKWTIDNYGPIFIPEKGTTIQLNEENFRIYGSIIQKYEGISNLEQLGTDRLYTFKKDYFFMLGDNRHNSVDSRHYGFIPEDYIQGKMIRVLNNKRD